ncbi:Membrane-bound inhibitor of C-type lysozyme [Devosia lucknowensis]|uniref:Membrane-bound inhibitor of C-type lysozyme n=1 Tax=Devosia lucknowensis TaxID=1096929 RepID=A0A1Y6F935_9HYPH|nr:MliC family protein [Devosia lucknowensis]SMQ70111.1 Membrane-bound inhibitor of C-type lysozyme [Devosia lucknowensis]
MTKAKILFGAVLGAALATSAVAQEDVAPPSAAVAPVAGPSTSASLVITIESAGDIERSVTPYQCDDGQSLSVQYINAVPNFLAIVPVDGQNLVMATALSASGARYVGGPYEWWTHQGEATLRDLTQDEDAEPLATCTAISNTP